MKNHAPAVRKRGKTKYDTTTVFEQCSITSIESILVLRQLYGVVMYSGCRMIAFLTPATVNRQYQTSSRWSAYHITYVSIWKLVVSITGAGKPKQQTGQSGEDCHTEVEEYEKQRLDSAKARRAQRKANVPVKTATSIQLVTCDSYRQTCGSRIGLRSHQRSSHRWDSSCRRFSYVCVCARVCVHCLYPGRKPHCSVRYIACTYKTHTQAYFTDVITTYYIVNETVRFTAQ